MYLKKINNCIDYSTFQNVCRKINNKCYSSTYAASAGVLTHDITHLVELSSDRDTERILKWNSWENPVIPSMADCNVQRNKVLLRALGQLLAACLFTRDFFSLHQELFLTLCPPVIRPRPFHSSEDYLNHYTMEMTWTLHNNVDPHVKFKH